MAHADINAAKNIRARGLEIVRGDSAKLGVNQNAQKMSQCGLGVSPSKATGVSPRSMSKRGEFGNLSNQDIKTVMS
jgi:putative transposase